MLNDFFLGGGGQGGLTIICDSMDEIKENIYLRQ